MNNFSWALEAMRKHAGEVRRKSWPAKNVIMISRGEHKPYIEIWVDDGIDKGYLPWVATHADLLATDWEWSDGESHNH